MDTTKVDGAERRLIEKDDGLRNSINNYPDLGSLNEHDQEVVNRVNALKENLTQLDDIQRVEI